MDQSLCRNCGHWREEHYADVTGAFQGQLFGCAEYLGMEPTEERAQKKPEELRASRQRIQEARTKRAADFYAGNVDGTG